LRESYRKEFIKTYRLESNPALPETKVEMMFKESLAHEVA